LMWMGANAESVAEAGGGLMAGATRGEGGGRVWWRVLRRLCGGTGIDSRVGAEAKATAVEAVAGAEAEAAAVEAAVGAGAVAAAAAAGG